MPAARILESIVSFRNRTTPALWLAVAAGLAACSDPSAPPVLTVAAVEATDGQRAHVGAALPLPISVRVQSDGVPKEGVTVTWEASAGSITPATSVTDAAGLASATWTLGAEPGAMTASTRVAGATGSPVVFRATALAPVVTASVAGGEGQTGLVGTALAAPLRVRVYSDGLPEAGATVHWHGGASLTPTASTTDSDGFTEAAWTLGLGAGTQTVTVTVGDALSPAATFHARATPGPAAGIATVRGAGQTLPANHATADPLIALVTDQYGNGVAGQAVTWTVERGPVAFTTRGETTDVDGQSVSVIAPTGEAGEAVVQATLAATGSSASFALTVDPPTFEVVLDTGGPFQFASRQNGSRPAVDTIPVGRTVVWSLSFFDYDNHGVASVGMPAFKGGDFPYARDPTVSVTFTLRGTYRYADPYYPQATGIVVVR